MKSIVCGRGFCKRLVAISLFFLVVQSSAWGANGFWRAVAPIERYYPLYEDTLAQLEDLSPNTPFAKQMARDLAPYTVIFVPGLFTDVYHFLSRCLRATKLPISTGPFTSLEDQAEWLKSIGVDVFVAPMNYRGSVEENGREIVKAILQAPKDVLLISHSKGGVDILSGLLRYPAYYSQLWGRGGKVKGWISLQSPFMGTPYVELTLRNPVKSTGLRLLSHMGPGGTFDSFRDLSENHRGTFFSMYGHLVPELTASVPTIAVGVRMDFEKSSAAAGRKLSERSSLSNSGKALQRHLLSQASPVYGTDGVVPTASCFLPGAENLVLEGLDHTMMAAGLAPFKTLKASERVGMSIALFRVLLQLIEQRSGCAAGW